MMEYFVAAVGAHPPEIPPSHPTTMMSDPDVPADPAVHQVKFMKLNQSADKSTGKFLPNMLSYKVDCAEKKILLGHYPTGSSKVPPPPPPAAAPNHPCTTSTSATAALIPPTPPSTPLPPSFKIGDIVQVMRSNGVLLTCGVMAIDAAAESALFQPLDAELQPTGQRFDTLFDQVRPRHEGETS